MHPASTRETSAPQALHLSVSVVVMVLPATEIVEKPAHAPKGEAVGFVRRAVRRVAQDVEPDL